MEVCSQGSRVLFLSLVCCNTPGKITQFTKQTGLCRQGWRVQVFCSSTASLYKQSPDSSLVIPECL